ncbi:MAG: translation elongation factor Ts [Armatimonadetes bacterium]|nr:translation elongation factor Ts [Armatimonadota bacterium]
MAISADMVKKLREQTGAGMMDCKKALTETSGDYEKAITLLREKGIAVAAKREARAASEGVVGCYIHTGNQIGVMVELNCETTFVAKTDEFQQLSKDIAMHISWSNPDYMRREDIPEEALAKEREVHRQWAIKEGKPENIIDRIIEGRMKEFYSRVCLLEQPYIKDEDLTVQDLINNVVAKLGEKTSVARFVRFRVGETNGAAE